MEDHKWCDQKSGDCDAIIKQPFERLKELLAENSTYYKQYEAKEVYRRFYKGFKSMLEIIDRLEELAVKFAKAAPRYDYSKDIKGNGFRSLLSILQHCIHAVTELVHYCQCNRDRFYFRTHHYCLEVEAYDSLLQHTLQMLEYANRMIPDDDCGGNLFIETFPPDLMMEVERVDRTCFYGRTLGFQFSSPGLRHFLHVVCVTMASFADGYSNHKTNQPALAATSFLNSGKYTVNPERRAKMIVDVTQKTSMEFCKAFWNLTEHFGFQHIPLLMCPGLKVNRVFHIPPEPFDLIAENGEAVSIAPPCSWSGLAPVQVRLLSYEWREGQSKDGNDSHKSYGKHPQPKSPGFLLHMHGGGFVAQSSKSHEMYLRNWARELNVPILSVDYSLAPEAPFPRALEECFFAYAWALKNKDQLGTTAEFVCIAGDSAGGNLSIVTSMRAAQYGIRMPDSILAAYSPFNMQYVPTPSRLFSLMDPLLPTGILGACLMGYTGIGKSPFDECTRDAIKSHTEKFTVAQNEKKQSGSFLSRRRESKDSKHKQCNSFQSGNLSGGPTSFDSFHSCNSSWSNQNGTLVMSDSPDKTKLSPIPNGILHSQKNLSSVGKSLQPLPVEVKNCSNETDQPSNSEHCLDISHPESQNAVDFCKDSDQSLEEPSLSQSYNEPLCSSPSRHDRRSKLHLSPQHSVTDLHVGVLYHKDGEECAVVNVVDDADSPTGEAQIFPLEEPHHQAEKLSTEEGDKGQALGRSRSMSQIPLPIAKNPFMSPLLATDEMLATLPPVDLVACTLDPILDDSVEFARRLKAVGNDVELYILENLPHGFLTFNLVCQEAREGCELCVVCLKRALSGKRAAKDLEKAPVY